jgi:hypothetical protein
MAAAEIVSGTFRSIAAAVISTDAANNTITVTDLANKRPVTLKIAPDSQMHQLPAMFAQRIAMRLKGADACRRGSSRCRWTAVASARWGSTTGRRCCARWCEAGRAA